MLLQSFFRYATKPEQLPVPLSNYQTCTFFPVLPYHSTPWGRDKWERLRTCVCVHYTRAQCQVAPLLSSQHMVMAICHVYSILGGYEVEPWRVGVQRYMEIADHFRGCQPSGRTLFLFV